jgi:hypothetical protein
MVAAYRDQPCACRVHDSAQAERRTQGRTLDLETIEQGRMRVGNVDPDLSSGLRKSDLCCVFGATDANSEVGLVHDGHPARVVLGNATAAACGRVGRRSCPVAGRTSRSWRRRPVLRTTTRGDNDEHGDTQDA